MPATLREVFVEFCAKYPQVPITLGNYRDLIILQGVKDKLFRDAHPEVMPADLAPLLNTLVAEGAVELLKSPEGLVYRIVPANVSNSHAYGSNLCLKSDLPRVVAQLEGDEKIVYQCIKAADNKGIWTRDLKTRTNLHQTIITKTLRSLESKKLIKSVKSVKNSTRKVFMLAHLEPSVDLTGGPWFSENELDSEFIDEMCKICYRYIASRSLPRSPSAILASTVVQYPSLEQVMTFITESGVTTASLSSDDVSMLLNRLIYDNAIQKVTSQLSSGSAIVDDDEDDPLYVYKATFTGANSSLSVLADLPCGHCPIMSQCNDVGPVSPQSCTYFVDWLAF